MTKQVRIIMGANYGDEGKGLLVDYFVKSALAMGESCIVVCSNGGSQRGHTVVSDGIRHVFHHFGSETLTGAATYIDRYFSCKSNHIQKRIPTVGKNWENYPWYISTVPADL